MDDREYMNCELDRKIYKQVIKEKNFSDEVREMIDEEKIRIENKTHEKKILEAKIRSDG